MPDYAKHTKRLSREALAVRVAIEKAQDPEKTFFDDLPTALGYSTDELQTAPDRFETFIVGLQDAISDIRTVYDELIGRLEAFLLTNYVGETVQLRGVSGPLTGPLRQHSRRSAATAATHVFKPVTLTARRPYGMA